MVTKNDSPQLMLQDELRDAKKFPEVKLAVLVAVWHFVSPFVDHPDI